jgi:ribulose-phosphate 3-epimerase
VSTLAHCLDELDLILLMSVNPGFGGQKFIDAVIPKIAEVKRLTAGRNILVQIDGGIGMGNLRTVLDQGVDVVVAGSSIFGSPDPAAAVREMFAVAHSRKD